MLLSTKRKTCRNIIIPSRRTVPHQLTRLHGLQQAKGAVAKHDYHCYAVCVLVGCAHDICSVDPGGQRVTAPPVRALGMVSFGYSWPCS